MAKKIKEEIFPRFGIPKVIGSDNGPAFVAYDFNLYTLSAEEQKKIKGLPKSLDEALDALEKDHDYLTKDGVFPQRLIDVWIERKRAEAKQAGEIPTPAEFMMYYDL